MAIQNTEVNFNVVETINRIVDSIRASELKDIDKDDEDTNKIADYLNVTQMQCVLFTAIYATSLNVHSSSISNLSQFFCLEVNKLLEYKNDFDELLNKDLVQYKNNSGKSIISLIETDLVIPNYLFNCIFNNSMFLPENLAKKQNNYQFINDIEQLIIYRKYDNTASNYLFQIVKTTENIYADLDIVKTLTERGVTVEDRIIFYILCISKLKNEYQSLNDILNEIYEYPVESFRKANELKASKSMLMDLDLIKITFAEEFEDLVLELTEKGLKLFFEEDAVFYTDIKETSKECQIDSEVCLIDSDKITKKELFFDSKLNQELSFLTTSLNQDNFTALQNRLKQKNLTTGITCLFHGAPGTGKTEMAYQIAKATGRSIQHVDISNIKSKWFGESEKNIKKIFDNYRSTIKKYEKTPILLFNEVDSVFSKRVDISHSNVQQTMNTIQNIILEELDMFNGILIATTNLLINMDSAFERRFLFKINYKQPSPVVREKIWKSKLPWLNNELARILASKYDLSGAEIDNIVRKVVAEEVLTGKQPDIDRLKTFCDNEKLSLGKRVKIGFCA